MWSWGTFLAVRQRNIDRYECYELCMHDATWLIGGVMSAIQERLHHDAGPLIGDTAGSENPYGVDLRNEHHTISRSIGVVRAMMKIGG